MQNQGNAPPPGYATITRVARGRSLRGVILFCVCCSFIWSLVVGVHYVRAMTEEGISSRLKTVFLVQGIMFFVLAGLETVGFHAAWKQNVKSGRLYVVATIAGGVLMTATEILRMALHFVWESDIKAACVTQNTGLDTAENVTDWCNRDWRNGIWRDAAWLIFGVICSILMYILSRAYYHQLLAGGVETAASGRYHLNSFNPAPYGQDPPFVPPYGPDGGLNTVPGYNTSQPPMYDAPAYAPPEKGMMSDRKSMSKDEEAGMESVLNRGDLGSHVEHGNTLGRSDSEVTLPGRQGEGRV